MLLENTERQRQSFKLQQNSNKMNMDLTNLWLLQIIMHVLANPEEIAVYNEHGYSEFTDITK